MTLLETASDVSGPAERVLVDARGLSRRRGDHSLWADLTFSVAAGASLAITGPSGAGKSTLLNCIGLLEKPDSGSLELDGTRADSISPGRRRRLLRDTVGHLFQNYGLVESWSVDRNIDVAVTGRRIRRGDRADLRRRALERVGLEGFGRRRTFSLSGGEQQRVALARLLMKKPDIVVADEPSAALDDANVAMVLSVLGELRDGGAAIVIATHDEKVADWCDEQLVLG